MTVYIYVKTVYYLCIKGKYTKFDRFNSIESQQKIGNMLRPSAAFSINLLFRKTYKHIVCITITRKF